LDHPAKVRPAASVSRKGEEDMRLKPWRPSHATIVAYVALFVAMGGTATAATGGSFILGAKNTAGDISVLKRSAGSPLSLRSGNGAAPLKVSSTAHVPRLNADMVDGVHAATLLRSLCAPGQQPTRRFRCTSSYMRHVPIVQPRDNLNTVIVGAPGVGFADCEGTIALGGGFALGPGEHLDTITKSVPAMDGDVSLFRPLGWRVEVTPNPANGGIINPGSFVYAICLKGNQPPLLP
jgi:hypothetical protein